MGTYGVSASYRTSSRQPLAADTGQRVEFDASILARTTGVVLYGRGAC